MTAVFGIAGWSGSGKTRLMEGLLAHFSSWGLRVNAIKHAHHDLVFEPPGKDSARFRAAGAAEVLVASPGGFAILHDLAGAPEPSLEEQLARLAPADLTLVEGFKRASIPRLEVWRPENGKPCLQPGDPGILAVATTDRTLALPVPVLDLDDIPAIAAFILARTGGEP